MMGIIAAAVILMGGNAWAAYTGLGITPTTDVTVNTGATTNLTGVPVGTESETVTWEWESSDEDIATVSGTTATVVVTGVAVGSVTITAKVTVGDPEDDGYEFTATKSVEVTAPTYTITITSTTGGPGVSMSPAGPNFVENTEVTLTATAAAGQSFSTWGGITPMDGYTVTSNPVKVKVGTSNITGTVAYTGTALTKPLEIAAFNALWGQVVGSDNVHVKETYVEVFDLNFVPNFRLRGNIDTSGTNAGAVPIDTVVTISGWTVSGDDTYKTIVKPRNAANTQDSLLGQVGTVKRPTPYGSPTGIAGPDGAATVTATITATMKVGGGSDITRPFTLGIPVKENINEKISFVKDTVEYNDGRTPVKIKPASLLTGLYGEMSYKYMYHTVGGTDDISIVPMDWAAASGTELPHDQENVGVIDVGNYEVTVVSESASRYGFKRVGLLVKGMVIDPSQVELVIAAGSEVYSATAKTPSVIVTDKNGRVVPTVDLEVWHGGLVRNTPDYVNAGKGYVRVNGKAGTNYSNLDTAIVSYDITKAVLAAKVNIKDTPQRVYDGTDTVTTSQLVWTWSSPTVASATVTTAMNVANTYTITNAQYDNNGFATGADSGTARVTVVVRSTSDVAKNYAFENGTLSDVILDTTVYIARKALEAKHVKGRPPVGHRYTGEPRPFAVSFSDTLRVPLTDTARIQVIYRYTAASPLKIGNRNFIGDTTAVPVDIGTYAVFAQIKDGRNFTDNLVSLGNYTIAGQVVAKFKTNLPATLALKATQVASLGVVVENADSANFVYQWYRVEKTGDDWNSDTVVTAIGGANDTSLLLETANPRDTARYFVTVTTPRTSAMSDTTVRSNIVHVTVGDSAIDIRTATVTVTATNLIYTGRAQNPTSVTVRMSGATSNLRANTDYRLEYSRNVNAGNAIVTVLGAGDYGFSTQRTYEIKRKAVVPATDVSYTPARIYNGAVQPVEVSAAATGTGNNRIERTGLGPVVAAEYISLPDSTSSTEAPKNAGNFIVKVKIGEGTNFLAYDTTFYTLGSYSIIAKTATRADFKGFTIPTAPVRLENAPVAIGDVTLDGEGYDLVVRYWRDGLRGDTGSVVSPDTVGSYRVTVEVKNGPNYFPTNPIELGRFSIFDPNGVKSGDRVIPGSGSEVVVVAPVQVVAGEFTVGPNPVTKSSGKAGFFWQGKPVKSGTLYVFDASGNLVKKVAVADKGISTARREIGAWNLGTVAEGTYLVKGVLVGKDGAKVKVSSIVGVR
jgi:hypothetical protein